MSIEGQGHFFTTYFPGFVLYKATISGERLQDHWSSGLILGLQIFFQYIKVGGGKKIKIRITKIFFFI